MKSTIIVKKRHFLYFLFLILFVSLGLVGSANYNINGHIADEIGPGTIDVGPSDNLNVLGNAEAFRLTGSDHIYIGFYPDGGARRAYLGFPSSGNSDVVLENQFSGGDIRLVTSGQVCINGDCQSTWGGGSGSANSLDAADGNPTEVVYVDNAGLVGVGTTNPGEELDVVGDLRVSGDARIGYQEIGHTGFIGGQVTSYSQCPVGTNVIGGGCNCISGGGLTESYPEETDNRWICSCAVGNSNNQAFAQCARISA